MTTPAALLPVGLALLALFAPHLDADDRRDDPSQLSIATFNANFLFDGRAPEGESRFPWKGDPAAARQHLRDIAKLVREVNADIVHLSEVEDLDTLRRLILEIGDPSYRPHLVPGRDEFTRQNVALLTRIDPLVPARRTDETARDEEGRVWQGVSKNYVIRFDVRGAIVSLIGLHLLAFPDDPQRVDRRELQAEVIRRLAQREVQAGQRLLIVLGDFNDYDPDVLDVAGNRPLSRTLQTIRQVDPRTRTDDLLNAASRLPRPRRFTAFFDRNQNGADDGVAERSMTDHILMSAPLATAISRVTVLPHDQPFNVSDHFPLRVTLDLERLPVFVRGDLDGDRARLPRDVVTLLQHLFHRRHVPCDDAADVNDDGRLGLLDALFLTNHLFGMAAPVPPPAGPRPGTDSTEDDLPCRQGGP